MAPPCGPWRGGGVRHGGGRRHSVLQTSGEWEEGDDGDEEAERGAARPPEEEEEAPALRAPLLDEQHHALVPKPTRFRRLRHDAVAWFYVVAYVFGAGVLSIPYAFAKSGLLAASLTMVVVTALSCATSTWVAESCARAEALTHADVARQQIDRAAAGGKTAKLRVSSYQWEIGEMFQLFYGYAWRQVWDISLLIYATCGNWLYASVFANSVAASVSTGCGSTSGHGRYAWDVALPCQHAYYGSLAAYFVFQCVLVSFDFKDAWVTQVAMVTMGIACVVLMAFTVTAAIFGWYLDAEEGHDPSKSYFHDCRAEAHIPADDNPPPYTCDVPIGFRASGFFANLSTFVFAQLFQHGAPALVGLCGHKSKAPEVFGAALSMTCGLYVWLGVSAALFFGEAAVPSMLTHGWVDYGHTRLQRLLARLIVVYPAISVTPGLVVQIVTLANAWADRTPWTWLWPDDVDENGGDESGAYVPPTYRRASTWHHVTLRWLLVAMACTLAGVMSDTQKITAFTGLLGYLIMFIAPALLQIRSTSALRAAPNIATSDTMFTRPGLSHPAVAMGVLVLTLCVMIPATIAGMTTKH